MGPWLDPGSFAPEADDLSIALPRLTADKRVKQGIYSSNFFIFWLSSRVLQGSFYSIKIELWTLGHSQKNPFNFLAKSQSKPSYKVITVIRPFMDLLALAKA